jgi:hypothetical protein
MTFTGARIQVYFDGALLIDITDNSYDFRAPLSSGGVSGEMGTYPIASTMGLDTVTVSGL